MHFELCWEYFKVIGESFEAYWGALADTAFGSNFCNVLYVGNTLGYVGSALACIAFASILENMRSTFGYFWSTLVYIESTLGYIWSTL